MHDGKGSLYAIDALKVARVDNNFRNVLTSCCFYLVPTFPPRTIHDWKYQMKD